MNSPETEEAPEGNTVAYTRIARTAPKSDEARAAGVAITALILAMLIASLLVATLVGSVGEVVQQLG